MPKCDDLLTRARDNPKGLRFSEAVTLAECAGYEFSRTAGSHQIFKHSRLRLPAEAATLNLQNRGGSAKPYQVRQILAAIDGIAEAGPRYAFKAFPAHFPDPDKSGSPPPA